MVSEPKIYHKLEGGMVNFESEVAYDFLIPSTTRGQSVIVSQNNGIIALIFDI